MAFSKAQNTQQQFCLAAHVHCETKNLTDKTELLETSEDLWHPASNSGTDTCINMSNPIHYFMPGHQQDISNCLDQEPIKENLTILIRWVFHQRPPSMSTTPNPRIFQVAP